MLARLTQNYDYKNPKGTRVVVDKIKKAPHVQGGYEVFITSSEGGMNSTWVSIDWVAEEGREMDEDEEY